MKAILMAAGRGTRISRMIEEVPKSTLPINGVPLIAHTVQMLKKLGFEVIVCVGYRQQLIRLKKMMLLNLVELTRLHMTS